MARKPRPGSVREVVTGRSDGYTGLVPFARLRESVSAESMLSGDFLTLTAAFEPDVAAIVSEPMRMEVPHAGSAFVWIPDYRIDRADGSRELVEVKPVEVVHPDRARVNRLEGHALARAVASADARFASIARAAAVAGFRFRLLTEDEIRVEPRLGNARHLLRHADDFFPGAWVLRAREALLTRRIGGIEDLQAALPDLDALVVAVRLAWLGHVEIDPSRPYGRRSRFTRVGGSRPHLS